jgi:hypothetical protein
VWRREPRPLPEWRRGYAERGKVPGDSASVRYQPAEPPSEAVFGVDVDSALLLEERRTVGAVAPNARTGAGRGRDSDRCTPSLPMASRGQSISATGLRRLFRANFILSHSARRRGGLRELCWGEGGLSSVNGKPTGPVPDPYSVLDVFCDPLGTEPHNCVSPPSEHGYAGCR